MDDLAIMGVYYASQKDEIGRWRFLCRWYSKTFHTPLPQVFDMPRDELIIAFWEEKFDAMSEDEKEQTIRSMSDNQIYEEDVAIIAAETANVVDDISKFLDDLAEKHKSPAPPKPQPEVPPEDLDFLEQFQNNISP